MDDALPADARRASHADRDAVAERLRDAAADGRLTLDELDERLGAAFGARTYAELDRLTADLPDPGPATAVVPRPSVAAPERVTGREGRRWSVAMMSGTTRKGRWVLGREHRVAAVMGGVDLDLREAELESREVVIWVFALMGGVDIVVPDDMALDASGFGFMGGFEQRDTAGDAPPDAPVVRVRGLALMGGVAAERRPRRSSTAVEAPHRRELGR